MAQPNCPTQKICIDCKKPYQPTSNVQQRCPACRKEFNKIKWREYSKKNYVRTAKPRGRNTTAPSTAPVAPKKTSSDNGPAYLPNHSIPRMLETLADSGCTGLIFSNVKITLEKI